MFVGEWVGFEFVDFFFVDEASDEFLEDVALEAAGCV